MFIPNDVLLIIFENLSINDWLKMRLLNKSICNLLTIDKIPKKWKYKLLSKRLNLPIDLNDIINRQKQKRIKSNNIFHLKYIEKINDERKGTSSYWINLENKCFICKKTNEIILFHRDILNEPFFTELDNQCYSLDNLLSLNYIFIFKI